MSQTLDVLRRQLPQVQGSWFEIKNQTGRTATIRIYEEIGFWGVTAEDFAAALSGVTSDEIEVQINSPGGDVFDGIAIYNTLRAHSARVTTRIDGIAASAASVIAQAGDHRVMLSASQMMIHNAWGLTIGNAEDMRKAADVLERQNAVIAGIYASRSGKDANEFLALMKEDTWLTDQETVVLGLADEVVDNPQASLRVPQSLFVAKAMATLPPDRIMAVEPPETLETSVTEETIPQAEYDVVVAERDALRTELEALQPVAHDAVDVAALPEPVQAALREADALKARVAKMEQDHRTEIFAKKAGEFSLVAPADEIAPILDVLDGIDPELAKTAERIYATANARISEAGVFNEFGTANSANEDSVVKAQTLIRKHMTEDGLDYKAAASKVFAAHPELLPTV